MKIAMIIPEGLIETAKRAINRFTEQVDIYNGTMNEGIIIAKELEIEGYDCIIARGGTKILLSTIGLKIPVVSVPITNMDIFEAISEAEKIDNDITLMAFDNMISACESYIKISGKTFRVIQVEDENDVNNKLRMLKGGNKKVIVGGGIINNFASKYDIATIVIKSSEESFVFAIEEAIKIVKAVKVEKESKKRITTIIENTKDGIICINNDGLIEIINKSAMEMLNLKSIDVLWKRTDDVLSELAFDEDIVNDVEEADIIKSIRGTKFVISKIPIKIDSETINILLIIKDIDEIHKLDEKIRQDIASSGHFTRYSFDDILGNSYKTKEIIRIGKECAKVDSTVLIEGETGTGKEVLAQSIHNYSTRSKKAFVAVNCAAIPENLLESELFGYAPGAFTGADKKGKKGLFEIAHGGTIFLDEISEMNPMLQGRLLRVLQEKQIMRIGDSKVIPIDVRVIAASNQDIYKMTMSKKFREDLYYRLNILNIIINPIRDRKEDIPYLIDFFIKEYCMRLGKETIKLEVDVKDCLASYNWPGNIREIRNFCERLCVMSRKNVISLDDIKHERVFLEADSPSQLYKEDIQFEIAQGEELNMNILEKNAIENALKKSEGNITKAAQYIGISRTTIWRKIKKYNIIVSR